VPFAVACVVGELKRHLRDTGWRLHVPRPRKEQVLRLYQTADELHQTLGRAATASELADHLQLTEQELLETWAAAQSQIGLSLDRPAGDDSDASRGDLMAAPGPREEPEDLLVLADLIAELPDLERQTIVLRYFQDLNQDDIAARIGYSHMHVSRLLRRALGAAAGRGQPAAGAAVGETVVVRAVRRRGAASRRRGPSTDRCRGPRG
jgi:RNA polymerase sigma-B factor